MAKQPQSTDQEVELLFPPFGVELSDGFSASRPGTAVDAVNVRLFEPETDRGRGGSRPGLSRLFEEQVDFHNLIQHLAVIVDPTTDALLADLEDGDFDDPSTNNLRQRRPTVRRIRRGGSGRKQNRRTPKKRLTITALDQTKVAGETFTFDGTEVYLNGLESLDTFTSATLYSPGARASAPASKSPFPIRVRNAIGTTIGGQTLASKYKIQYVNGSLRIWTENPAYNIHFDLSAGGYGGAESPSALMQLFINGLPFASIGAVINGGFSSAVKNLGSLRDGENVLTALIGVNLPDDGLTTTVSLIVHRVEFDLSETQLALVTDSFGWSPPGGTRQLTAFFTFP